MSNPNLDKIIPVALEEEMKSSYIDYAMSVIYLELCLTFATV